MWCQFCRWKLVLTSNLEWPEREKSLLDSGKKIIQIAWSHSRRSPKHWYYWKIVEEFLLKCTKFKHVDKLVRDNSSLKCFTLGCIVYFYLFKASVSQNNRPQRFFPSLSLELLPAWAAILDSPWWATRRSRETVTSPQSMPTISMGSTLHSRYAITHKERKRGEVGWRIANIKLQGKWLSTM